VAKVSDAFALDIALQPKQEQLLRLMRATGPKVATWIGFGGARGGAKTGGIRRVMLQRRFENPGTTGFIIRRNWGDIVETFIEKYKLEFPQISQFYHDGRKEFRFPNGSRLAFKYGDTLKEIEQVARGPEAFDLAIDQAEQFTEQQLILLHTPNRWPGAAPGAVKTILGFNPGGAGTAFLRRVFWLKQYQGKEQPHEYAFIQAYGWDNYEWFRGECNVDVKTFYSLPSEKRFDLFISETSEGRKMNALPEYLRLGELLGRFDNFAGQYFSGVWDESKCVITASDTQRIVQPWWKHWTSMDWGFKHWACQHWYASGKLGPDQLREYFGTISDYPLDVVIVKREHVAQGVGEPDLALECVARTPEDEIKQIKAHFLSPDAFAKRGSARTIAEQMDEVFTMHGLPKAWPADDDRIGGWRFMYNCFRQTCQVIGKSVSRETALSGFPLLLISANCVETISAIPMLVHDPKKTEDVEKQDTVADDVADCLRYGIKSMMNPHRKAPIEVRQKEVWDVTPGDVNAKVMALRIFNEREKKVTTRVRSPW